MTAVAPAQLNPHAAEVLVSRTTPHPILAATAPWLHAAGFAESDAVGRSLSIMQGEGTCRVTLGALWSALQVRTPANRPIALYAHPHRAASLRRCSPRAGPLSVIKRRPRTRLRTAIMC